MRPRIYRSLGVLLMTGLLMSTVSLFATPTTQAQDGQRCFDETGYCINGRIREFWEQNGGLPVFGLPITPQQEEQIEGQTLQVQWFERNRLELHPQNAAPYDVLLGRLGVDVLEQQGRDWRGFPTEQPQDGCRYFEETSYNVCGDILTEWRANALELDGVPGKSEAESLALFGLPISPAQTEVIQGQEYTVQWFERARFELHPQNDPANSVLLGLLGREVRTAPAASPPPATGETLDQVQIGALETYTHSSGVFSIDVPDTWRVQDESSGEVVVIGFVDPTENGLIAVSLFSNPTPMALVDPALMGAILQEAIQSGFADKEDLVVGEPEPQPDGSVKVSFTLSDSILDANVRLQGSGYIREDGNLISLLWVVAPEAQFAALEPSFNTIISSYQVDTSVTIP